MHSPAGLAGAPSSASRSKERHLPLAVTTSVAPSPPTATSSVPGSWTPPRWAAPSPTPSPLSGTGSRSSASPDYHLVPSPEGDDCYSQGPYCSDVDDVVVHAEAAGATVREPLMTFMSGDRFASIRDPSASAGPSCARTCLSPPERVGSQPGSDRVVAASLGRWARERFAGLTWRRAWRKTAVVSIGPTPRPR